MSEPTDGPFDVEDGQLDTAALFSNVLMIEDEPSHAKLIARALRGVVGTVHHAPTGEEAFKLLSSTLPELVLCDLRLPDMDGLRILETIRSARPGLPTIVMTSSSDLNDAVTVMRAGAWDYMVKAFDHSFAERVNLVITRCARRKLQQMRELQVRAERDAFAAAVRSSPDGMAVVDREGGIVFSNESFLKLYEQLAGRVDEPESRNIVTALSAKNEEAAAQLASVFVNEDADTVLRFELCVAENEDDAPTFYEMMLTSTLIGRASESAALDIRRFVIWTRDITDKKAQERFQRDVLSTTSHDLKGPLGAILTSVELLNDENGPAADKAEEMINRIGSCARTCVTLIDELLSARRIQDGVLIVRPTWISVAEVFEDVILDYRSMARDKSIELDTELSEENLDVYADKLGIRRILANLVSNAIKYTPKGGRVLLQAKRGDRTVLITVADNGSGIEPEARPHLFDRYTRLDKHTGVEGTGLGLFVTKSIVDAHSGTIELKSQVGAGTTFIISFPDGPT